MRSSWLNVLVLFFFVLATFPAYKALRHPYMISGHDGDATLFKTMEMDQALVDGHFPVRWSKRLNFGLGQPTFTFLYNLPYYLAVGLHRLGLDFPSAVKMIMGMSFPIGAWGVYLWLTKYVGRPWAVIGGFLYVLIPYQFANVYVRFALGEVVAGMLAPLTFYLLDNLLDKFSWRRLASTVLGFGLLILSNNFYALVFSVIWIAYAVYRSGIKKGGGLTVLAVAWSFILCAYFIFPAYIYKDLTHLVELPKWFASNDNFANLWDLIRPSWGFGGYKIPGELPGLMSVQVGLVQWILLAGSMVVWWKKGSKRTQSDHMAGLWIGIFWVGIFMMLKESNWVWRMVPILQNLQFPWRLLFVTRLAVTFCGAYFAYEVGRKIKVVGVVIVIALFVLNRGYWQVGRYYTFDDKSKIAVGYPGTLTMTLEETPLWHSIYEESNPHFLVQIQSGKAKITPGIWKTNYHKFTVDAVTQSIINDKTHYWPGWEVWIDGQKTELFDMNNYYSHGLITFSVSPGKHVVESRLGETPIEKTADIISLMMLVALGLLYKFPDCGLGIFKQTSPAKLGSTQKGADVGNV